MRHHGASWLLLSLLSARHRLAAPSPRRSSCTTWSTAVTCVVRHTLSYNACHPHNARPHCSRSLSSPLRRMRRACEQGCLLCTESCCRPVLHTRLCYRDSQTSAAWSHRGRTESDVCDAYYSAYRQGSDADADEGDTRATCASRLDISPFLADLLPADLLRVTSTHLLDRSQSNSCCMYTGEERAYRDSSSNTTAHGNDTTLFHSTLSVKHLFANADSAALYITRKGPHFLSAQGSHAAAAAASCSQTSSTIGDTTIPAVSDVDAADNASAASRRLPILLSRAARHFLHATDAAPSVQTTHRLATSTVFVRAVLEQCLLRLYGGDMTTTDTTTCTTQSAVPLISPIRWSHIQAMYRWDYASLPLAIQTAVNACVTTLVAASPFSFYLAFSRLSRRRSTQAMALELFALWFYCNPDQIPIEQPQTEQRQANAALHESRVSSCPSASSSSPSFVYDGTPHRTESERVDSTPSCTLLEAQLSDYVRHASATDRANSRRTGGFLTVRRVIPTHYRAQMRHRLLSGPVAEHKYRISCALLPHVVQLALFMSLPQSGVAHEAEDVVRCTRGMELVSGLFHDWIRPLLESCPDYAPSAEGVSTIDDRTHATASAAATAAASAATVGAATKASTDDDASSLAVQLTSSVSPTCSGGTPECRPTTPAVSLCEEWAVFFVLVGAVGVVESHLPLLRSARARRGARAAKPPYAHSQQQQQQQQQRGATDYAHAVDAMQRHFARWAATLCEPHTLPSLCPRRDGWPSHTHRQTRDRCTPSRRGATDGHAAHRPDTINRGHGHSRSDRRGGRRRHRRCGRVALSDVAAIEKEEKEDDDDDADSEADSHNGHPSHPCVRLLRLVLLCFEEAGLVSNTPPPPPPPRRPHALCQPAVLWYLMHRRLTAQLPAVLHRCAAVSTLWAMLALEGVGAAASRGLFVGRAMAYERSMRRPAGSALPGGSSTETRACPNRRGWDAHHGEEEEAAEAEAAEEEKEDWVLTRALCRARTRAVLTSTCRAGVDTSHHHRHRRRFAHDAIADSCHTNDGDGGGGGGGVDGDGTRADVFCASVRMTSYAEWAQGPAAALWQCPAGAEDAGPTGETLRVVDAAARAIVRQHASLPLPLPLSVSAWTRTRPTRTRPTCSASSSSRWTHRAVPGATPSLYVLLTLLQLLARTGDVRLHAPSAALLSSSSSSSTVATAAAARPDAAVMTCIERDVVPHCHAVLRGYVRKLGVRCLSRSGPAGAEALWRRCGIDERDRRDSLDRIDERDRRDGIDRIGIAARVPLLPAIAPECLLTALLWAAEAAPMPTAPMSTAPLRRGAAAPGGPDTTSQRSRTGDGRGGRSHRCSETEEVVGGVAARQATCGDFGRGSLSWRVLHTHTHLFFPPPPPHTCAGAGVCCAVSVASLHQLLAHLCDVSRLPFVRCAGGHCLRRYAHTPAPMCVAALVQSTPAAWDDGRWGGGVDARGDDGIAAPVDSPVDAPVDANAIAHTADWTVPAPEAEEAEPPEEDWTDFHGPDTDVRWNECRAGDDGADEPNPSRGHADPTASPADSDAAGGRLPDTADEHEAAAAAAAPCAVCPSGVRSTRLLRRELCTNCAFGYHLFASVLEVVTLCAVRGGSRGSPASAPPPPPIGRSWRHTGHEARDAVLDGWLSHDKRCGEVAGYRWAYGYLLRLWLRPLLALESHPSSSSSAEWARRGGSRCTDDDTTPPHRHRGTRSAVWFVPAQDDDSACAEWPALRDGGVVTGVMMVLLQSCPDVALLCAAALHLLCGGTNRSYTTSSSSRRDHGDRTIARHNRSHRCCSDGSGTDRYDAALPMSVEHELARLLVGAGVTRSRVHCWRAGNTHHPVPTDVRDGVTDADEDEWVRVGAEAMPEVYSGRDGDDLCARATGPPWRVLHARHISACRTHLAQHVAPGHDDEEEEEKEKGGSECELAQRGAAMRRELLHLLGSLLLCSLTVRVISASVVPNAHSDGRESTRHAHTRGRSRDATAAREERGGVWGVRCLHDPFLRDFLELLSHNAVPDGHAPTAAAGRQEEGDEVHKRRVSDARAIAEARMRAVVLPSLQLTREDMGGGVAGTALAATVWHCRSWKEVWQRGLSIESRAQLRRRFRCGTDDTYGALGTKVGCSRIYCNDDCATSVYQDGSGQERGAAGLDTDRDGQMYTDLDTDTWLQRFA